jgi:flagellar basal-body rod protein FlgF
MSYGLYISAEGAQAQSTRLEAISNNIANASTPGFKRDFAIIQARYAEETERGRDYPGSRSLNDLGGGVMVSQTKSDFSGGPLQDTGVPTDLAIRGDGFFMVRRGNQDLLTRNGNFKITNAGELQTQDGYSVLSADGNPVVIDDPTQPWQISDSGGITQGASTPINLALVRPASLGDLAKRGENLFAPLAPTLPVEDADRQVVPGHLELSTVKPAMEMVEMIETTRAYETNVNMVRFQDTMLGNLLSRLMKAS